MVERATAAIEQKYVRVIEERADGLVEFEFAIGFPEIYVELMLPKAAFEEFCAENRVVFLPEREKGGGEFETWDWNLSYVSRQRFRSSF